MKRKSIFIYSVVISCVFAAAVVFFAANVLYEYAHGGARARRTFDHLARSVKKDGGRMDFQNAVGSLDDYAALRLYQNAEAVFAYPDGTAESMEATKLVAVYQASVPAGGDVYTVVAALYVLRPSVIFRSARISFIAIMIATLSTAALIVYLTMSEDDADASGGSERAADGQRAGPDSDCAAPSGAPEAVRPEDCGSESNAAAEREELPAEPQSEVLPEAAEEESAEADAEDDADQLTWDFSGVASESGGAEPAPEAAPEPEDKNECVAQAAAPSQSEPEMAAQTAPESFAAPSPLEERLSEALERAEGTDGDVSLLMVSVSGTPADGDALRSVRVHLFGQFSEAGSVLEVGANRFAVVRSGLSIDEAETVADSIQSELCRHTAGTGAKCCIGISSKSERNLPASRLILEAEEALRHAEDDSESSIVAFHVDIEKYREYIKSV